MKKYNVTVNGTLYEVEIEEVGAEQASAAPAAKAAPAAAPKAAPAAKTAPAAAAAGSTLIKAPMAGTIVKVNVGVGQAVKKGDIIAVLEAMKMENEIFAPADGTVASVNVNKGAAVKADDLIASLK